MEVSDLRLRLEGILFEHFFNEEKLISNIIELTKDIRKFEKENEKDKI